MISNKFSGSFNVLVVFFVIILGIRSVPSKVGEIPDLFIDISKSTSIDHVIPVSHFDSSDESSIILSMSTSSNNPSWLNDIFVDISLVGYSSTSAFYSVGIKVEGNYAFIVDYYEGFKIVDISNYEDPFLLSSIYVRYPRNLFIQDDYAYINSNDGLFIFDISDKRNPTKVGSLGTYHLQYSIYVEGNYCYSTGYSGSTRIFIIFDVTSKSSPSIVSTLQVYMGYSTFVHEDFAYVADYSDGLLIINTTEKHKPHIVGRLDTYEARGVFVGKQGNVTYLSDQGSLFVVENTLLTSSYNFSNLAFGLMIIDTTDKFNPVLISSLVTGEYSTNIFISDDDNFAYITNRNGLDIINVTDPSAPILVGNFESKNQQSIFVTSDDHVFIGDGPRGLKIVDCSVKSNPVLVGDIETMNSQDVEVDPILEVVYLADDDEGLKILDVSNKTNPVLISEYDLSLAYKVIVDGHYAYLADYYHGVQIIDISNISHPEKLGVCSDDDTYSIFVEGNYTYIVDYYDGVKIFDTSDKRNPFFIGTFDGYQSNLLFVHRSQMAYVCNYDSGMNIYDISLKSNPQLIVSLVEYKGCGGIYVDDEEIYLYLTSTLNGLVVLDLRSNPIRQVGVFGIYRARGNIIVEGDFVFASHYEGVVIVDVRDKANMKYLGSLALENVESLVGKSNHLYAASRGDGLKILKFGDLRIRGSLPSNLQLALEDHCVGNLSLIIVATDSSGVVESEFTISFFNGDRGESDNLCYRNRGVCDYENFNCSCNDDKFSGKFCSSCIDNYYDVYCNKTTCNGIYSNDTMSVCTGHGKCLEYDTCSCERGYEEDTDKNNNNEVYECSQWKCGVYSREDVEQVCNKRGTCSSVDFCECDDGYSGILCELWNCGPIDSRDPLVCSGNGVCVEPDECKCTQVGYRGELCETEFLFQVIFFPSLGVGLFFLSIFGCVVFVLVCCFCCVLLCLCGFLFSYLMKIIREQRIGINRYRRLKNFDLLLQEQLIEENDSVAHLKVNSSIFSIPMEEIQVISLIGEGGSRAMVFKVLWQQQIVAFKCYKTRFVCNSQDVFDEFEKEVQIIASIHHPFVIRFYGATLHPPRVGIIMEYCENGEILEFFKSYGKNDDKEERYPLSQKLRMVNEILSSVVYLHTRSIIHRDLKPGNVLIDQDEHCKLMDFGLSKFVLSEEAKVHTKRIGTSFYMAPEVVNDGLYNQKCDVFSFGILVWVLMTENENPYGKDDYNIQFRVAKDPSLRPSIQELRRIIRLSQNMESEEKKRHSLEGKDDDEDDRTRDSINNIVTESNFEWFFELLEKRIWVHSHKKRYSFALIKEEMNAHDYLWKNEER